MSTSKYNLSETAKFVNSITDDNKIFTNALYSKLCEFTNSAELTQLFWMNATMVHYLLDNDRITISQFGVWYPNNIHVYRGVSDSIIVSHQMLRLEIPSDSSEVIYTSTDDQPLTNIVNVALIPILKTVLNIFNVTLLEPISDDDSFKSLNDNNVTLNVFPPSLMAAKYGNTKRCGVGKNKSKHDIINMLKPYVSSEYDLVSLRTRNDIIWEKLKAYDTNKMPKGGACVVRDGTDENGNSLYTIYTSLWHIEISPISSGVNVLYNKFRKMSKDNVDDLRAVAEVVCTITNIINS